MQTLRNIPREFVSDDNVSTALEYLNSDTEAVARYNLTKAENALEAIKGRVYGEKEGAAETRKAARDCDQRVCEARDIVAEAQFDLDKVKARIRWATTVWEIWRTQSSNARSAHSVR